MVGGGSEDLFIIPKATIGHPLSLPLHLVVDITAPSSCHNPSLCATSENQNNKKHYICSYTQCNFYPLVYLAPKTMRFTCITCSVPVQKSTYLKSNKHSPNTSATGGHWHTACHQCLVSFNSHVLQPAEKIKTHQISVPKNI